MSAWIPLFQTALWVGLIVWLVLRYKAQVSAVLIAVQKRIEHGSSVKAGPFELGEGVKPQSLEAQKVRLTEETKEGGEQPSIVGRKPRTAKSKYLLVEDLVMRKLQSEFAAPINRQVTVGRDIGLDGLFVKEGAAFGVEVKYLRSGQALKESIRALDQALHYLEHLGWRRFTFILVFVFEGDEQMRADVVQDIQKDVARYGEKVMVRFHTLPELEAEFGISHEEG